MTIQTIRRIAPNVVERMAALMPWHFSEYGEHGISYHVCRYCGNGSESNDGLWKYGVRHWVCSPCRDAITCQRLGNEFHPDKR